MSDLIISVVMDVVLHFILNNLQGVRVGFIATAAWNFVVLDAPEFVVLDPKVGGIQDDEVPGGSGNEAYTDALEVIEDEMQDYIHDNTDDEITHHQFLNA